MASASAAVRFEELQGANRFSRQQGIAGWSQQALACARVLVAGAGALGNELLKDLALLGVGTLGIIDFDRVEETNLPRCVLFRPEDIGHWKAEVAVARLRELSPGIHASAYVADLQTGVGAGLVESYDLLLGAVDSIAARWQLNRLSRRAGVCWIDAGVDATCGQVAVFNPTEGACYECGLTESMWASIHERHSCGAPGEPRPERPPLAVALPVVALTAALQAQEAVHFVMRSEPLPERSILRPGERLSVSLQPYELTVLRTRTRASCLAHGEPGSPARPVEIGTGHTAMELLNSANAQSLHLDWEIVYSLICCDCGPWAQVLPVWQLRRDLLPCPRCGRERAPEQTATVRRGHPLASHTLTHLGVPPKAHLLLKGEGDGQSFWCKIA